MKLSRSAAIVAALMASVAVVAMVAWAARSGSVSGQTDPSFVAAIGDVAITTVPNSPAVTRGDWPNLFGPTHNCVSPETNLALDWPKSGPNVRWRRTIGTGYSTPVVSSDRMILFHRIGDEERIECLRMNDGEPIWSSDAPTTYKCKFEYTNGPSSTPAMSDGRVYAWGAEGLLRCVDLGDGQKIWQRNLITDYQVQLGDFGVASSPLIDGDRVILNLGGAKVNAGIIALDKRTGETLWTATDERASHTTPIAATIHDQRLVFVLTELNLVALDAATGHVLWSEAFHARSRDLGKVNATSPVVAGDLIFVTAYQVGCLCIRVLPDGGHQEVWRGGPRVLDSQYTNLVCHDGYVYGSAVLDRSIRCLRLADGEVIWKAPSTLGRGVSMLAADRRLILFGELGQLATIPLGPSEPPAPVVTKSLLKAPSYSAPVLSGGMLLLRNERELVCFDLRKP